MKSVLDVRLEPSLEEKRAALDFALGSETLGRSDRLKSLLRFVCEAELSGDEHHLTEYEIAISALGRREDFSPNEDSTVRSRAYELRRKLERLYTIEAPEYPLRIDLPKGSYRPRFDWVEPAFNEAPQGFTAETAPPPKRVAARRSSGWIIGAASFVLGCCASILVMLAVIRHPASKSTVEELKDVRWTPELRELWTPLLIGARPLVVTFQTPLFVDVGPVVVRSRDAERMHEAETSPPIMQVKRLFNVHQLFEARRYTDFSVANALFAIAQLTATSGISIKAERALDLTNEDVRSSNMILLGKPGFYDGIKELSSDAGNFVYQKGESSIENLHPMPGEQAIYQKSGIAESTGAMEEYAIIRMTRGPGVNQHTLNLISAESEMYWPLAMFITDPVYARDLADHLRLPSGKLPESFEVLVKAELSDRRPIQIQYVAHRVISLHP